MRKAATAPWTRKAENRHLADVVKRMREISDNLTEPRYGRGAEFLAESLSAGPAKLSPDACDLLKFIRDPLVKGALNSSTREHMPSDIGRYFFAACFAQVRQISPKLRNFPTDLLPDHQSAQAALASSNFSDRFRVQLADRPATTIVSHIAKDGHAFIHPDPAQCRALTVREAARLQSFPDNYFFCGNRTEQYVQVGNAVPPFLAKSIASVVHDLLTNGSSQSKVLPKPPSKTNTARKAA